MSEEMMVATERAKGGTGTRGTFLKEVYRHREYLLLLLPALIIFVLFRYIPMAGIVIAFKKYTIAGGLFGSPWVGFTYFERLFDSEKFYQVLWNSIRISFLKIAIGFPGPIIFALLLNEVRQVAWKKSFQTISYLPHFVSWVVVGGIVRDVLSVHGVVNGMIGWFGAEPRLFLQEMHSFLPIVITSMIWKKTGSFHSGTRSCAPSSTSSARWRASSSSAPSSARRTSPPTGTPTWPSGSAAAATG